MVVALAPEADVGDPCFLGRCRDASSRRAGEEIVELTSFATLCNTEHKVVR
jgi:hypothetical protein